MANMMILNPLENIPKQHISNPAAYSTVKPLMVISTHSQQLVEIMQRWFDKD